LVLILLKGNKKDFIDINPEGLSIFAKVMKSHKFSLRNSFSKTSKIYTRTLSSFMNNTIDNETTYRLMRSIKSDELPTFSADLKSLKPTPLVIEAVRAFHQSEIEKLNTNIKDNTRNSLIATCMTVLSAPTFYYSMNKIVNTDTVTIIEGVTNIIGFGSPALISGGLLVCMPWIILNQTLSTIGYVSQIKKLDSFKKVIDQAYI
jgi:hypothetical protein